MVARTAWVAGNGVGFTWTAGITAASIATLATGNTFVENTITVSNGTSLDMLADVSIRGTLASSTTVAGANVALFLFDLLDDGTSYGDGQFTPGTAAAKTPVFPAEGQVSPPIGGSTTTFKGIIKRILLAPGTFHWAIQNNLGFSFTACSVLYRTYNINLNN